MRTGMQPRRPGGKKGLRTEGAGWQLPQARLPLWVQKALSTLKGQAEVGDRVP